MIVAIIGTIRALLTFDRVALQFPGIEFELSYLSDYAYRSCTVVPPEIDS